MSPKPGWDTDGEFQSDCLAFMLFHGQNRVVTQNNVNHCLPFSEKELNAPERFESHFMHDFIAGKLSQASRQNQLLPEAEMRSFVPTKPVSFRKEAQAVLAIGRAVWQYYYQQSRGRTLNSQPTLYEIKAYFKGRNAKGKLNNKSKDVEFNRLLDELSYKLQMLAEKIQPKVYEYGFLRS